MSQTLLQIGEFAKQADTNLRTLRYYEELGLIKPAHRSSGKFRYYSPDQLKRVGAIKRMQGLGLSLKEIQEGMVPTESELTDALAHIEAGLDAQIALVGGRIESLQGELSELKAARQKLADCRKCGRSLDSEECRDCNATSPAVLAVLRSLTFW